MPLPLRMRTVLSSAAASAASSSSSRHMPPLSMFAWCALLVCCLCSVPPVLWVRASPVSVSVLPPVHLTLLSTASGHSFITRASEQYAIMRKGEVEIEVREMGPGEGRTADVNALYHLAAGSADAAFLPLVMTPEHEQTAPDLTSLPLWASAFAPVYNVAEAGDSLVLTQNVLALIWMGNITYWDHPLVRECNPRVELPRKPITMVMQSDASALSGNYVRVLSKLYPDFLRLVTVAPATRYAAVLYASGNAGPGSLVSNTPYSIGLSLVGVASKLDVPPVNVVNAAGVAVRPSLLAVQSALTEMAVSTTRGEDLKIVPKWTGQLSGAPGRQSWPFVQPTSLLLPRTYSRQGCRARSELSKFLQWLLRADSIRFTLAIAESVTMLASEVDDQLGVTDSLSTLLKCGDAGAVNVGALQPLVVGGPSFGTADINVYPVLLEIFRSSRMQSSQSLTNKVADERTVVADIVAQKARTDVGWVCLQTYSIMYPNDLAQKLRAEAITVMHQSILGVVPIFSLPTAVASRMSPLLTRAAPLRITMELLAHIYLGDIASWTDPRLLELNPALATSFAQAANSSSPLDAAITVVLCGQGRRVDAPLSVLPNHFLLALNNTRAFASDPDFPTSSWTLPANLTRLIPRLTARGVKFLFVTTDQGVIAAVRRIPGAIGFMGSNQEGFDPTSAFALVKTVEGQQYTLTPSVDAYLACAAASTPTLTATFLLEATRSTAAQFKDCWPMPILFSLVLPREVHQPQGSRMDVTQLCSRHIRVAHFAQWMSMNPSIVVTQRRGGRAAITQLPAWKAFSDDILRSLECDDEPILWRRPVVWHISKGVEQFAWVGSAIGIALCVLVIMGLLHFRHRTLVRTAGLKDQLLVVVGAALVVVLPLLLVTSPPTARTCSLISWFGTFGITCMFVPLYLKIYRVHFLAAQRKGITTRKAPKWINWLVGGVAVIINLAVLIAAQTKGGMLQAVTHIDTDSEGVDHIYDQCALPSSTLPHALTLLGIKGGMLLYVTLMAFGVRHVSSAFGESVKVSWGLYNTVLCTLIVTVLLLLTDGVRSSIGVFLLCFLAMWVSYGVILFVFGYKFLALVQEDVAAKRIEASSRMGRSRGAQSRTTASNGVTNSGTSLHTNGASSSVFNMPSLDCTSLSVLEKYITALETQIVMARARRRREFGEPVPMAPPFNSDKYLREEQEEQQQMQRQKPQPPLPQPRLPEPRSPPHVIRPLARAPTLTGSAFARTTAAPPAATRLRVRITNSTARDTT